MLGRSLPPECCSPWLSRSSSPAPKLRVKLQSDFSQTSEARFFVSLPSGSSGNAP